MSSGRRRRTLGGGVEAGMEGCRGERELHKLMRRPLRALACNILISQPVSTSEHPPLIQCSCSQLFYAPVASSSTPLALVFNTLLLAVGVFRLLYVKSLIAHVTNSA